MDAAVAHQFLTDLQSRAERGRAFRKAAMTMLSELRGYDWCGVYRLEGDNLLLDEYVGAATDHTTIPVGRGVCGTAVAENENQVVEDVRELENYLSCSLETRSEIVVLIRRDDRILGQIDIDGHRVGSFDKSDEQFLERVAESLAGRWE
jgi:GAF domain-containing protein